MTIKEELKEALREYEAEKQAAEAAEIAAWRAWAEELDRRVRVPTIVCFGAWFAIGCILLVWAGLVLYEAVPPPTWAVNLADLMRHDPSKGATRDAFSAMIILAIGAGIPAVSAWGIWCEILKDRPTTNR